MFALLLLLFILQIIIFKKVLKVLAKSQKEHTKRFGLLTGMTAPFLPRSHVIWN